MDTTEYSLNDCAPTRSIDRSRHELSYNGPKTKEQVDRRIYSARSGAPRSARSSWGGGILTVTAQIYNRYRAEGGISSYLYLPEVLLGVRRELHHHFRPLLQDIHQVILADRQKIGGRRNGCRLAETSKRASKSHTWCREPCHGRRDTCGPNIS